MKKLITDYNIVCDTGGLDDIYDAWMTIISNCPAGLEMWERCSTNYKQLQTIYFQRKGHKLKEDWGEFIKWIESLPYAHELIIGDA